MQVIREGFLWVFEKTIALGGSTWGHCRRQIDQPLGVGREPAHYFERRSRILLAYGDAPLKPRLDDPLTKHILNIEKIVLLLLRS